ncbi:protease modulator HflC [Vibrio hibernica]|uniref:protease modulator HflC n=1 Tax=Vibrio hibernica TaxID=2587465 RepID=UPI0039B00C2E
MRKLFIPLVAILIVVALMSVFVIPEGERGIVIRFGRILKDTNDMSSKIYPPGLHMKMPFFDNVKTLDARIQTMDGKSDRFVTSEKKDVIIDTYVKWKISDFGKYYLATGGGNTLTAETLLGRKVTDILRSEIGAREIKQIVSGPRSEIVAVDMIKDEDALPESAKEALEMDGERDKIMLDVLDDTRDSAMKDLGVELVDFRMKKINLPDEISESIYRRMRAERESVARKHRSQGREKAEIIRAQAELEVATTLAEADKTARVTRGDADAKVATIYAQSYNQDPEFYSFLRSLKAYEKSFSNKSDLLVLDPKSDFFKYMNQSNGRKTEN